MKIKRSTDSKSVVLEELMRSVVQAKKDKEEAENHYKLLQQTVMEHLESKQQKSATVQDGGKKYKITYVKNERTQIDSDALKKEMGARAFNKYTVRTLDRKKLEEGIALDEIDQVLVGKHVSIQHSNPFLRVTEQQADDQEQT